MFPSNLRQVRRLWGFFTCFSKQVFVVIEAITTLSISLDTRFNWCRVQPVDVSMNGFEK